MSYTIESCTVKESISNKLAIGVYYCERESSLAIVTLIDTIPVKYFLTEPLKESSNNSQLTVKDVTGMLAVAIHPSVAEKFIE